MVLLEPLDRYVRQYAGVLSMGQSSIYASFLDSSLDERWRRQVIVLCDGNSAWGVAFDVGTKTFGEVHINGRGRGSPAGMPALEACDRCVT